MEVPVRPLFISRSGHGDGGCGGGGGSSSEKCQAGVIQVGAHLEHI